MVATDVNTPRRVGEVIEANSAAFIAQCYQLYDAPPMGALVHVGSPPTYGVVYQIRTEPLDPSRPVLARGEDAASEEQVYLENPQIPRLLTSRFEALIVGHQSNEIDYPHLPALPPRVHSFVYTCGSELEVRITANLDFLRLLVRAPLPVADEAIGACLQVVAPAHTDGPRFLVNAGRVLATELSGDLPRLNAILRRMTS